MSFSLQKSFFARCLGYLCFCLMIVATAMAQTGSIIGRVTTPDNQPASAVSIGLVGQQSSTITNANGEYLLTGIKAGSYFLKVSSVEYNEIRYKVQVQANQSTTVNLVVTKKETELREVVINSAAKKFAEKKSDYVARMPLKNLENPQVYTVVPKEMFEEQVVTDLKTALQVVPGLSNVTQGVGSGGIGLSIRLRGFSGTNAGGAIRNGMATNWVSLSDPVNLEAIEVIKGPSGTLFGGVLVSYGGLVNRVTKKPLNQTAGNISYSGGSFGLSRLSADVSTPLNAEKTLLFRVNAALHNEKSFQDFGRTINQVVAPSLTYKVNDKLTFDFDFELFNTRRNTTYIGNISTSGVKAKSIEDLNFDFKKSYTTNDLLSASKIFNAYAKAEYRINDKWRSVTNYSFANSDNQANYLFLNVQTDSTMYRNLMHIPSTFGVNQVQQNINGDFKIGSIRNRLLVGLDYFQVTSADRRTISTINYDGANPIKMADIPADLSVEKYQQLAAAASRRTVRRNFQTYSAYASDVINFTEQLSLMASLRIDRYFYDLTVNGTPDKYNQTSFSPKFGAVYQVIKDKVSLFGNYMNGFTNVGPVTIYGSAEKQKVKPEKANQLEGGIKFELAKGRLNGTLSVYDIRIEDKIRPDQEHSGFSLQDGTQSSKGFDFDLIANPFKGMHVIVGYGNNESVYSKADSSVAGLKVTSAPKHTANTWISYKFSNSTLKGFGIGFGGNYQSESYFVNSRVKQGNYYAKDPYTFKVAGFTRMDGTVFYEQPKYRLGVKLNNIANKKYWTTDAYLYRESTRQLIVNLTYKF